MGGFLKQWDISEQEVSIEWGQVLKGAIKPLTLTQDLRYIFAACADTSELIQIGTDTGTTAKNYGKISKGVITALTTSASSELQFTGDSKGHLKIFSIRAKIVIKEIKKVYDNFDPLNFNDGGSLDGSNAELDLGESIEEFPTSGILGADGQGIGCMDYLDKEGFMFIAGEKGNIFQYKFKDGRLGFVKRFANVHNSDITVQKISLDEKNLFSADTSGGMKKISIGAAKVLQSYGKVVDGKVTGIELVC